MVLIINFTKDTSVAVALCAVKYIHTGYQVRSRSLEENIKYMLIVLLGNSSYCIFRLNRREAELVSETEKAQQKTCETIIRA